MEEAFSPRAPLFPLFFPSSSIGKRKFDKTFTSTQPLADNQAKKEVNLSFARCRYPLAIKLNRPWQIELLEERPVYIIETIPLITAIFWNPNFVPYPRHTLNLVKKLGLKIRNFSSTLDKECIQLIWANRTIGKLNALFKENPNWWSTTVVIYSQPLVRNVKGDLLLYIYL